MSSTFAKRTPKRKIPDLYNNQFSVDKRQKLTDEIVLTNRLVDVVDITNNKVPDTRVSYQLIDQIIDNINKFLQTSDDRYMINNYYDLEALNPVANIARIIKGVRRNPNTGNYDIIAYAVNPERIVVSNLVISTIYRYLMDKNFQELKGPNGHDEIYYAIVLIMMRMSDQSFDALKAKFWPKSASAITNFISIVQSQRDECVLSLISNDIVVPFGSFKYLLKSNEVQIQSKMVSYVSSSIMDYWYDNVSRYLSLIRENVNNTTDEFNTYYGGCYYPMIENDVINYETLEPSTTIYLTGTACVGKSSVLGAFKTTSRGGLGGFNMKCISTEQAAALNAAVNELSFMNVIGDRGTIDNILWTWIMANINTNPDDYLKSFVIWLDNTFNILSLMHFMREQVTIIVDPNPEANRLRMMERGTGGDADRSRIRSYPLIQSFAYYAFGRLVGWNIHQTQYEDGLWKPNYSSVVEFFKNSLEFKKMYNLSLRDTIKQFKPNVTFQEYPLPAPSPASYSVLGFSDAKAYNIYK